jgi:hypothetical protein
LDNYISTIVFLTKEMKNEFATKTTYDKSVEPTPPSFVIRLYLDSVFILFLSIILFAKWGCSPRR